MQVRKQIREAEWLSRGGQTSGELGSGALWACGESWSCDLELNLSGPQCPICKRGADSISSRGGCTNYMRQFGKCFPGGASGKEPACQCRRRKGHGSDPWVGRPPGGGMDNPLWYSCSDIIPGTEEPGGLQSIGLQRVRHERSNLART